MKKAVIPALTTTVELAPHIAKEGKRTTMHRIVPLLCGLMILASTASADTKAGTAWPLPVKVEGRYGFIDGAGTLVIPPRYESAGRFQDGLAVVSVNGTWGYINPAGLLAIMPVYDHARDFSEGKAVVGINGLYGFIDRAGVYVVVPVYEDASEYGSGMAAVRSGGKQGYVDLAGRLVIQAKYDEAYAFGGDGMACVRMGGGLYFIDRAGKPAMKRMFPFCTGFHEGMAGFYVGRGSVWGFMDRNGRTVVPPAFQDIGHFSEGLAPAKQGGKWGYVGRDGKYV